MWVDEGGFRNFSYSPFYSHPKRPRFVENCDRPPNHLGGAEAYIQ